MTNREKYAEEILNIACQGNCFCLRNGEVMRCIDGSCCDCSFGSYVNCGKRLEEWSKMEYVEPMVDWNKVTVDTPILVKQKECDSYYRRYFAKYEEGKVYAWCQGATSWSDEGVAPTRWNYAKLVKREG